MGIDLQRLQMSTSLCKCLSDFTNNININKIKIDLIRILSWLP